MKKILRFILLIICMIVLVELNSGTLINDVKGIFDTSQEISFDNIYSNDTIPKDYLGLLNAKRNTEGENKTQLSFLYTLGYKSGYPISNFICNKQYYLQIYKVSNSYNFSLKSSVKEFFVNASHSGSAILNDRSTVNYSYQPIPKGKITTFNLELLGKQTQIILKNDSIAYYYSRFKNFSIQHNTWRTEKRQLFLQHLFACRDFVPKKA